MSSVTPRPWVFVQLVNEDGGRMTAQDASEYVANTALHGSEGFYAVQARKDDGKLYDVCHTGNGPDSQWNASAIAEAVNYHERLVEALRKTSELLANPHEYKITQAHSRIALVSDARALLAELEKEPTQ